MHLELSPKCLGMPGEAGEVFAELRRFAVLLAEENLVVNEIEKIGGIDLVGPVFPNVGFGRHPFSVPPSLTMVPDEGDRTRRDHHHGFFLARGSWTRRSGWLTTVSHAHAVDWSNSNS